MAAAGWLCADFPAGWPAGYPEWWYNAADPANSVIDVTKPLNTDNYAVLNQGQLWNIAENAINELNEQLAPIGRAGFDLSELENGQTSNYYAPANLGQLKFVSSKFYERFTEVGYVPVSPNPNAAGQFLPIPLTAERADGSAPGVSIYPWTENVTVANVSPAVLGQAKHLFSWNIRQWIQEELSVDSDSDGLPDIWESYWGLNPTSHMDAGLDSDSDKLTNQQEFGLHTDPTSSSSLDGDTLPDDWEIFHGLDITLGVDSSGGDSELDGATAATEFSNNTDPNYRDHPDLRLILY